eukprot:753135-Pyramimonas_sp.AAC.2
MAVWYQCAGFLEAPDAAVVDFPHSIEEGMPIVKGAGDDDRYSRKDGSSAAMPTRLRRGGGTANVESSRARPVRCVTVVGLAHCNGVLSRVSSQMK